MEIDELFEDQDTEEVRKPDLSIVDVFKAGNLVFEAQIQDDLRIDKQHLSDMYESHSQKFAFYSTAYELALAYENKLDYEVKKAYAVLDEQVRVQLKASVGKSTEKMVENVIITTPAYVQLYQKYLDARLQTGLLKAARDAMIQRKDMLVSLGANYRAEVNADPSLLIAAYKSNQ